MSGLSFCLRPLFRGLVCSSAFHGLGTVRLTPVKQAALTELWRSQRDIRQKRDAKHIAHIPNRQIRHCLTFGESLPSRQLPPCYSSSTMPPLPRLPRAFHAVSLAATSIASRTTFVVCVPIALLSFAQFARPSEVRQYPSGNHGSFRAALRRRQLCADPLGVMQPPSRPPAKAGITPIPLVCTASSRNHICIYRHTFSLSACHSRASEIPLYAFPRRSHPVQVVLSKSKSSLRGVTRSVGGVRLPWLFVPHPTNGTPMLKNANQSHTTPAKRRFTEGMARNCLIFTPKRLGDDGQNCVRIMRRKFEACAITRQAQTTNMRVNARQDTRRWRTCTQHANAGTPRIIHKATEHHAKPPPRSVAHNARATSQAASEPPDDSQSAIGNWRQVHARSKCDANARSALLERTMHCEGRHVTA